MVAQPFAVYAYRRGGSNAIDQFLDRFTGRARLDLPSRGPGDLAASAPLVYLFATAGASGFRLRLVAVPEHPLTAANRVRSEVVDTTAAGRSEQWKEDVLSNVTVRTWRVGRLAPGMHTLTVHALD